MEEKIVYRSFGGGTVGIVRIGFSGMMFSVSEEQIDISMPGLFLGRDD